MERLAVWSESYLARFSAIDRSDTMTLNAAFGVFQEAAVSHAENLGVGREAMARTGQVWILSRMSVQVDRRPRYGEALTVRSWPRSWERLFAIRDFDMRDAQGHPAIRARSCWIIIDIEKRRPVRPQAALEGIPMNEGMDALAFVPAGLEERPSLQKTAEQKAVYTDVDYNGHVNNVSYIRWIENAVEPALLESARQSRLDINYMNEILPGESAGIWSGEIGAGAGAANSASNGAAGGAAIGAAAGEGALRVGCSPAASDGKAPPRAFAFEGKKLSDGQSAFRAELRLWL